MNRFAAIDIGTNSVLLLVADRDAAGRFTAVCEHSEITRLGQGVDQTKKLAPEAMETTLKTLERYAAEARELGASGFVVSATSAARDSSNGAEFIAAAKARAGLTVEIISGAEEARLSWASAYSDFGGQAPLVVLDIGGGSTEFIFGAPNGEISFRHSFDVGSVRMTERHVHTDPPSETELAAIDALLVKTFAAVPKAAAGTRMVGVAGTVTTVAAVAHHVTPYDPQLIHGSALTLDEVSATLTRLASLPTHLRKTVPGLQPRRADVIVAGVQVLRAAMQAVGVEQITVSDRGLRWGLLADRFGLGARK
jgi:exopolyphosphatase/guanosine-5'-triphosphate,3'-diphosphate pyrophosphatase